MARCNSCGADLPDYYTSCPQCGSTSLSRGVSAAPPPPVNYGTIEQRKITTAGEWFLWMLLCGLLPVIGPIIMLCCTKDKSVKNFAVVYLIFYVISLILAGFILVPAMLGYVEKSRQMHEIYGLLLTVL